MGPDFKSRKRWLLLDRLDHSGYEVGPLVLQDPDTINEIRDYFLIDFYDVYLKVKAD